MSKQHKRGRNQNIRKFDMNSKNDTYKIGVDQQVLTTSLQMKCSLFLAFTQKITKTFLNYMSELLSFQIKEKTIRTESTLFAS